MKSDKGYYCPLDGSKLDYVPGGIWMCRVCRDKHPERTSYYAEEFLNGFIAGYGRAVEHIETKLKKMHKFIRADFDFSTNKVSYKYGGQNGH